MSPLCPSHGTLYLIISTPGFFRFRLWGGTILSKLLSSCTGESPMRRALSVLCPHQDVPLHAQGALCVRVSCVRFPS